MLENLIAFFARRHLLANMLVVLVLVGAVVAWERTPKDAMPNFTLNFVTVRTVYPGASPEDVERLVTREIENELRSIDGVYEIVSTSTVGLSTVRIEFQPGFPELDEAVIEIRNAVQRVRLPGDIRDDPVVRLFRPSRRAVMEMGLYLEAAVRLTKADRERLQATAFALENRLLGLVEVGEVTRDSYHKEEIRIQPVPARLRQYNISIGEILNALRAHNIRQPAGKMEDYRETRISLIAELATIAELRELVVRSSFDGPPLRLGQVADIEAAFAKNDSITKINGREGVILRVVKTTSADIIGTTDAVKRTVADFRTHTLAGSDVRVVISEDASVDVRNRLSLISVNGLIGFALIVTMLLLFLDFRSGLWVAVGIPFTFGLTMVILPLIGYTINNITLAAVIIVMGMVVDDAIVVAENISRMGTRVKDRFQAAVHGTREVFLPIMGSITTTCVAFVPLYFFSGRFGLMIAFIPAVIFLMLFASLFESTLILPGHLTLSLRNPFRKKGRTGVVPARRTAAPSQHGDGHWFFRIERAYARFLERVLRFRWLVITAFFAVLFLTLVVAANRFKFVMFPQEETTMLFVNGQTAPGTTRTRTSQLTEAIEEYLRNELSAEVVGFRSHIARSRRGGAVNQNSFVFQVELLPVDQRRETTRAIRTRWEKAFRELPGIAKIDVAPARFGQTSGSPIEVVVQENDDAARSAAALAVAGALRELPGLKSVEVEAPMLNPEFKFTLNREMLGRLDIDPGQVAASLRTAMDGTIAYELNHKDEEVDVRVVLGDEHKRDLSAVLDLPIQNKGSYLVPLRHLVRHEKVDSPSEIPRRNHRRILKVFADFAGSGGITPLEIAEHLEEKVFPELMRLSPTTSFSFGGEIKDTRETGGDLAMAVVLVLVLIFTILALLFNSFLRPLIIMLAIPFGAMGVIVTFVLHGISLIGFFTMIGVIGLCGVVINDSIVMVNKMDLIFNAEKGDTKKRVAGAAASRLRAVILTTLTTVAGVMPTAYGIAGYDSMLAEMMLALSWGLIFGSLITLVFVPCAYSILRDLVKKSAPALVHD